MNEAIIVQKIAGLVGALQAHATAHTTLGLNDVGKAVEILMKDVLKLSRGWNLENANKDQANHTAIDLYDDRQGIAVQVTLRADTAKRADTVKKFNAAGLRKKYAQLFLVGFVHAAKPRKATDEVTVLGPSEWLNLAGLPLRDLIKIESRLRQSYDFGALHPYSDLDCFKVIVDVMDRPAIFDPVHEERSLVRMRKAFRDIGELIATGTIIGKQHYAKPLSQYGPDYRTVLENIYADVTSISRKLGPSMAERRALTRHEIEWMETARANLVRYVNSECEARGVDKRIKTLNAGYSVANPLLCKHCGKPTF